MLCVEFGDGAVIWWKTVAGTNILIISDAIAKIKQALADEGLHVKESSDFKKFAKSIEKIEGKKLTEQFSLDHFELNSNNAFWIGIYDAKNRCVSIQAARLDVLGNRNLNKHWRDQQSRIYEKPNKIGHRHAPSASLIRGRVLYHGDFFVAPEIRGTGKNGLMVFLGFLVAQAYFKIDWAYGLMNERLAITGFPTLCGYSIIEPRGTQWTTEPSGISEKDFLVAASNDSIIHRAEIIAEYGVEGFLGKRNI